MRPPPPWLLVALCGCERARPDLLAASLTAGEPFRAPAVQRFAPDDLWRHNDGAAERYLQLGFDQLWTGLYQAPSGHAAQVEVYLMVAPAGAHALLEADLPTPEGAIGLGEGSQLGELSLSFQRGRCYARLVSSSGPGGVPEWLPALGRAVDAGLAACEG
ncbi:MAG: DUF6599 family protein [Pseudomonadota bacterium]